MGIAVYSPPLDSVGNSVRAVTFFKYLMQAYPCGIFDAIVRPDRQLFVSQPAAADASKGLPDDVGTCTRHWRERGSCLCKSQRRLLGACL